MYNKARIQSLFSKYVDASYVDRDCLVALIEELTPMIAVIVSSRNGHVRFLKDIQQEVKLKFWLSLQSIPKDRLANYKKYACRYIYLKCYRFVDIVCSQYTKKYCLNKNLFQLEHLEDRYKLVQKEFLDPESSYFIEEEAPQLFIDICNKEVERYMQYRDSGDKKKVLSLVRKDVAELFGGLL